MTIEVKQLVIKSTVLNERHAEQNPERLNVDIDQIKESLLQECREMIAERFSEMRER